MSNIIAHSGSPTSPIWVVIDRPFPRDAEDGIIFSCPYGWVFKKMWEEAGLSNIVPFIMSLRPELDSPGKDIDDYIAIQNFKGFVEVYKPPFLLPVGKTATALLCPETILRRKGVSHGKNKTDDQRTNISPEASLDKYSSSLLVSPFLDYGHYAIPQLSPVDIIRNWEYRNIGIFIDLGRVRDEYTHFNSVGVLRPPTERELVLQPSYYDLLAILRAFRAPKLQYLSVDIETIRAGKASLDFKNHPGFPYTISFADSPQFGVSFSFWDFETWQCVNLFRELDYLLTHVPQIGQNYFSFDTHFLEALGFTICLEKCQDTMIRHHILWPELEHKLQFQTKQYTRQKFYKDEGKGWSPKNKKQLFHYNALDSTVTFEIFLAQEEEFDARPRLR
jgi:hypothetical protein